MSSAEVNNPLFARCFDRFFARDMGRGEDDLRRELLAGLHGSVVEVGPGNGINFEHYPPTVEELVAVEPEPYLRSRAQETAAGMDRAIRVLDGTADRLPLADAAADAVVIAGVLCSVPDQQAALAEFRRVLRPGGELRFYEHVGSGNAAFRALQGAVDALFWTRALGGCVTTRDTLTAVEEAGFEVATVDRGFHSSTVLTITSAPYVLGVARR
jgi:ubiquinone/menaquinone biosynthesis C-methylase UbiE